MVSKNKGPWIGTGDFARVVNLGDRYEIVGRMRGYNC
jgi:hypothetical protein